MITSRITSKAQTTVPQAVRTALGLREGDELAYEIRDGQVLLSKARAPAQDDPFVHFDEWDSDADRRAYGDL
ncbi:AbrB/MazE/SpoVT family DNA-binding domain-containing protein [Brevundimonas goettingensis]|uniref:Type II toxin-antitoxin system PrlF family antitoxin n=1 Tax=Brevundimonas goettingensis TaxID=2774190 RepID=A0A975GWI6_9CAUL|nr:type II toxin-antitoxin system PrlF family antitoxin [Brevundimonas goettingensis]QTC92696.1 type II toxin-antitoxin system PrlF family antitoxin [Brevundimonas goettingensis]